MDNAEFEELPPDRKFALLMGLASALFGEATVRKQVANIAPLVADMVGHGAKPKTAAGDADVPEENFWGGVWRIHDCR